MATTVPIHVGLDMHVGLTSSVLPPEIESVLSVFPGIPRQRGTQGFRHQHVPLDDEQVDPEALATATDWAHRQVALERPLLICSGPGRQAPALVAGLVLLRIGARPDAALKCLRDPGGRSLLNDPDLLELLID